MYGPVVAATDEEVHKQVLETVVQARATHMHMNLNVTDWVAVQWEDPILRTMIGWISKWKVQDLKHILGDDTDTKEGMAVLQEHKKLLLYQGPLYHHHKPAGELEEAMQFIVSKDYQVPAMNRCHRDAGHQGQQQMLYLLQDWFWWPGMTVQMQKKMSKCKLCIQHGSTNTKAPMQPIIVTTPLELLHNHFMGIETTVELDQPPNMVNISVFCRQLYKTHHAICDT